MRLTEFLDPKYLINTFGIIGIGLTVFAESGLLVGFFLPGDSLLFTAGILAAAGKLNIAILVPVVFVAAVVGDQVGYAFGARAGSALYKRPDSRFFKREHLEKAHAFYERRGASTIVLARFIPFVRTFAPIVAGAARMRYRTFVTFNVIGGLIWAVGVTMAGYGLGRVIPDIDKFLLPIIGVIVLASIAPMIREWLKHRKATREG
ncbi:MAG TPA: VTT domain-containing protein [Actinomycetota bacterium]|nr:VTT domain-containing protein [Actinomycetota bacterium]